MINIYLDYTTYMIYNENDPCPVCLATYITNTSPGYINKCGHWLCASCFTNINKCPLCTILIDYDTISTKGGSTIFIKTLSGATTSIVIDLENTTYNELVKLYTMKTQLYRPDHFVCAGKALNNNSSLLEQNVQNYRTIHYIDRLRGD